MDKIYTRYKLRIPKMNRNWRGKPHKKKKTLMIIVVLTLIIITIEVMLKAVHPVFSNLCEEKAKEIATIVSNEQATNVMKNYSYEKLFEIEKDNMEMFL